MLCNWTRMLRRARGAQLLLRIKIRRSLFRSEQALCQSVFLPAPVTVGLAAPHPACLTAHIPTLPH